MFNRHIQASEHRQHIRPPGAAAASFGVQRVADFAGELPPVEETQPLNEVDMGLEGPVDNYSYSMASRTADRWLLDDLAEMSGLSTRLSNGWEILQTNGGGPVLFREFNDYDSGKVSPPDSSG